jgi:mRNA interferase RelE/StbE
VNFPITKDAARTIQRMDTSTRRRVYDGIKKLPAGDVKKLRGFKNSYRLRIGDWRIIFTMIGRDISIDDVLPRGDAYK